MHSFRMTDNTSGVRSNVFADQAVMRIELLFGTSILLNEKLRPIQASGIDSRGCFIENQSEQNGMASTS